MNNFLPSYTPAINKKCQTNRKQTLQQKHFFGALADSMFFEQKKPLLLFGFKNHEAELLNAGIKSFLKGVPLLLRRKKRDSRLL